MRIRQSWEGPSPNSDYDVRFIYVHWFYKYLVINNPTSHLTFPIDDELDLHRWDLKKTF
ncbi:DNA polymerase beta superfamily protein [Gilliamella apicola]|uniref:DNA polymerase beta superfamily protein n=1 Tax=Gilliamella sp. Bim3-2 TaxID=3120235 RepID=UPI0009BE47FF